MAKFHIQEKLLYHAKHTKMPINIILLKGVQITCTIIAFDMYSILVKTGDKEQLIFKHAISTIQFAKPVGKLLQEKLEEERENREREREDNEIKE